MIPALPMFHLILKGIRACRPSMAVEPKAAALLVLGIAVFSAASAQQQTEGNNGQALASAPSNSKKAEAGKPEFDAASVRLSTRKFYLAGWDFLEPASDLAPPAGGLFSWNVPFSALVAFAYDLESAEERDRMSATLPKWAQMPDGVFAVEARAEGNPTRDDVRQMVRSLLEERFQFAAHFEKRSVKANVLVVEKPGLLKPHPEGAPCTLSPAQTDEGKYPHVYLPYKVRPAQCGVYDRNLGKQPYERRLEMLDVTMPQIADALRAVDGTGLTGRYDAVLDVSYNLVPQAADAPDDLGLPSLPAALEKQLGLKLVKQSADVDVFVIDNIAPLSEN
jgi:uncharacterized protein (TIGR03435 family)